MSDNVAAWLNHEDTTFVNLISEILMQPENRNLYGLDVRDDVLCIVRLK